MVAGIAAVFGGGMAAAQGQSGGAKGGGGRGLGGKGARGQQGEEQVRQMDEDAANHLFGHIHEPSGSALSVVGQMRGEESRTISAVGVGDVLGNVSIARPTAREHPRLLGQTALRQNV